MKIYRYLAYIFIFIVGAFAVISMLCVNRDINKESVTKVSTVQESPKTSTSKNDTIVPAKPARLIIPKIDIDTVVEHVGNTESGAMDVPEDPWQVAWYALGYVPGTQGNAVIAGHYDTKTTKAIFFNLKKLIKGDEIIISDEKNQKLRFIVKNIQTYPDKDFPISMVFGSSQNRILNLITCSGSFDTNIKRYSDRIVVSAEFVDKV